jgi:Family of unknown function (DUF6056)
MSQSNQSNRLFYTLLAICNLSFLIYYLVLGYYNQPALDDYCVIAMQKDWGFNSPITYWYKFWNGRFLPLYLCNIFLSIFEKTGTTIWFSIFLIIGFIFSLYRILNILSRKYLPNFTTNSFETINIAALIFNIFVFNNFKFNTFFWLNASTMYFGGILFLLIGLGEIISPKKRWFSFPLIIFSFAYAGCSTENHALVMVLGMFGIIFISAFLKKYFIIHLNQKFFIGAVSLLISFILLITAPGSQHRISSDSVNMAQNSKMDLILNFFKNFSIKYFLLLGEIALLYMPIILLITPIFLHVFINQLQLKSVKINTNKLIYWPFLVGLILLIGAAIAPTIYIFGNLGPQRVLTIVNALLLFFTIISLFFISIKSFKLLNINQLNIFSKFSLIILTCLIIFRIRAELPTLKAYSQFEINKRASMKNNKNKTEPFIYKNPEAFETSTISEKTIMYLLEKFAPNQIKNWKNIVKHEAVLPNIIDKTEIDVYESCYGAAFGSKIKIIQ